ncbi:MAG: ATP-binding protein, partial [Spirochaetota bacterium]
ESAANLTKQLLAFSRKQIIDPRTIDPNEQIGKMKNILSRLIGEDIHLSFHLQQGVQSIKVDRSQLQQIIINLAVNARDAMPKGGSLTLETANVVLDEQFCRCHAYPIQSRHVMIAVSDTGIGMSKETMEHLFEPFFTTKGAGKGTGLGLATVYGAAKQNGGIIDVYSEQGAGTTFKIYFPVNDGQEDASPLQIDENMRMGTETILVVEDNPLVLNYAFSILQKLGYTILKAANGEEALETARSYSGTIDMMMTDIILPGMNGWTLAQLICESRPGMKVLYNSGYTEDTIVERGVLKKGLHFIGKPFSAFALASKIREVLDGKE